MKKKAARLLHALALTASSVIVVALPAEASTAAIWPTRLWLKRRCPVRVCLVQEGTRKGPGERSLYLDLGDGRRPVGHSPCQRIAHRLFEEVLWADPVLDRV